MLVLLILFILTSNAIYESSAGNTTASVLHGGSVVSKAWINDIELRSLQGKLIEQQSIRQFLRHLNLLSSSMNEIPASVTLFAEDAFKDIIGAKKNIFVFPMVVNVIGMGNSLGRLFQAIGMAIEAGLHLIVIPYSKKDAGAKSPPASSGHTRHRRLEHQQQPNHEQSSRHKVFFDALLITYRHPHPTNDSRESIVQRLNDGREEYPWGQPNRAWKSSVGLIPKILDHAIDAYLQQKKEQNHLLIPLTQIEQPRNFGDLVKQQSATGLLNATVSLVPQGLQPPPASHKHISTTTKGSALKQLVPLIPDAVIVFRCNEVLVMKPGELVYGFQNFNVYSRLIPRETTKSIYILTEPRDYNNNGVGHKGFSSTNDVCSAILDNMTDYLQGHFKQAAIGVIRGHQIDSFVRLARAPVVISTASTFSFWPMLANRNHPYFQMSHLVVGNSPHHLTDNFTFITVPRHMNFGDINIGAEGQPAVDRIIAALRAVPPSLNDTSAANKSLTQILIKASIVSSSLLCHRNEWLRLENRVVGT